MMPSGWREVKFGDLFSLTSGKTKPKNLTEEKDDANSSPVYGGNGIIGYSPEVLTSNPNIIIGRVGEYCGTVRHVNSPCWITDNALYIRELKEKIDVGFLAYKLQYFDLTKLRKKGGQPLVSQEPIYNAKSSIPSNVSEQEKIAKILSTWDEAIDYNGKQVRLKEKYKADLALKILSGKYRLRGYSQTWSKKKLREIGSCVRGLTYSPKNIVDDGLLVLRSSNILNGQIALEDNVYVDVEVQDQYLSKPGDILICVRNGSRNLIGKTALIPEKLPKATHGAFMSVFRTKYSSYVFQLLQTEMYYGQVAKNLGATINSINNSDLLEFSFPFPDDDKEIQDIAAILESFDREISLLRRIGLSYQKQKQGLMQQLLTGKKRVKV